MERHPRRMAVVRPDAESDLLGHCAARQEYRRFLAQESCDFAFEVAYQGPFAVAVGLHVAGFLRQLGQDRPRRLSSMAEQEAFTMGEDLIARGIARVRHQLRSDSGCWALRRAVRSCLSS